MRVNSPSNRNVLFEANDCFWGIGQDPGTIHANILFILVNELNNPTDKRLMAEMRVSWIKI